MPFFISCQQATLLIEKQAELAPSLIDRGALKLHLLYCAHCSRYAKQSAELNHLLSAAAERRRASQSGLSDQARQRLQMRLSNAVSGARGEI